MRVAFTPLPASGKLLACRDLVSQSKWFNSIPRGSRPNRFALSQTTKIHFLDRPAAR
jgi:hypothetical protein